MIKYLLLIFLLLESGSALAQIKKPPKVFENDTFSIVIPVGWKKYDDITKDKNAVFQIAPRDEIQEEFYIQSSGNTVTDLQNAYGQASKGLISSIKLHIYEEPLEHDSLEGYIKYRSLWFAKRENKFEDESQTLYKESEDHFVEIVKFRNLNTENLMYNLMHWKSHDGRLYQIIFIAPEDKLPKYINDAKIAFASFEFL